MSRVKLSDRINADSGRLGSRVQLPATKNQRCEPDVLVRLVLLKQTVTEQECDHTLRHVEKMGGSG